MDIRLSNRMAAIADMVDERTVADIGCDHAFVSIRLIQAGTAERVIAMDVREGPLEIARANVAEHELESRVCVRQSNGFSALLEHEAECAVIAGLGGPLMVNILRDGERHIKNGIHLVLQPQSELPCVRAYLFDIGYEVVREIMLSEEGKYYTVMKAVPAERQIATYTEAELLYGRILLASKNPTLMRYLSHRYEKNRKLMAALTAAGTGKARERMEELRAEQRMLVSCLGAFPAV